MSDDSVEGSESEEEDRIEDEDGREDDNGKGQEQLEIEVTGKKCAQKQM